MENNYYIDFEFHSYAKPVLFGSAIDTIEPISIGMVSHDDREYYAVCNSFDVKAAWNNDWLRQNVLVGIFYELAYKEFHMTHFKDEWHRNGIPITLDIFKAFMADDLKWFTKLISKYGKSHEQISNEIISFVYPLEEWQKIHPESFIDQGCLCPSLGVYYTVKELLEYSKEKLPHPEFYGYMSAFDYICLTDIMGGMSKWPSGWKYYFNDLAQSIDYKINLIGTDLRVLETYPVDSNNHNALQDAKYNKQLHEFIQSV